MKKIFLLVVVAVALVACKNSSSPSDKVDDLVKQLYPELKVESKESHDGEYEIHIVGGVEIDCDAQGQWTKVKDPGGVPVSIVPAKAKQYIDSVYMGRTIVEIEREAQGYEIELYGKIDLIFDHDGNFLKEDYDIIVVE